MTKVCVSSLQTKLPASTPSTHIYSIFEKKKKILTYIVIPIKGRTGSSEIRYHALPVKVVFIKKSRGSFNDKRGMKVIYAQLKDFYFLNIP